MVVQVLLNAVLPSLGLLLEQLMDDPRLVIMAAGLMSTQSTAVDPVDDEDDADDAACIAAAATATETFTACW